MFARDNIDPKNIPYNYKNIADEFCNYYYTTIDNDYLQLDNLFKPTSKFTFVNDEFIGFNNIVNKWKNEYNINSFNHNIISYNSQPIDDNTMLVKVIGSISINNIYTNSSYFTETFVVKKDKGDNLYIHNTIFQLL